MNYAELQTTTNFSFLRGASHPEEFVSRAKELGYLGLGITDRNSLAGVVRAHTAAKAAQLKLLIGARLDFSDDTPSIICYPKNRRAYGMLSSLITIGKGRAGKGGCLLYILDVKSVVIDCVWIIVANSTSSSLLYQRGQLALLKKHKPDDIYLAAQFLYGGNSSRELANRELMSQEVGIPLVATNDAHAHSVERRSLQDVLACIREHSNVDDAGGLLFVNAERYLKSPQEMIRIFRRFPAAIANTARIVEQCNFSLDELRYEYPDALCPPGTSADSYLESITFEGAHHRYPQGVPAKVSAQLRYELAQIAMLKYAPYFLTVFDIVNFARSQNILCQGRGSAANSAVCYCIGITAVDPVKMDMLFERFISSARDEPPDIDVDFEHERREEVMQYIYAKYGREYAGIAATVITYRTKSAVRDVGKALAMPIDVIEQVLRDFRSSRSVDISLHQRLSLLLSLVETIRRFPRHLSQHVGGFVITRGLLSHTVPIGNAAMPNRTFIEWDKDDLDSLGMLKIDVLALGMLTCISRCFKLIEQNYGRALNLATVPSEDPKVYEMLSNADSIGVFQVESRAQMSMLPRLRPQCFYDLVIEVAIVRPGPIQGGMVHPYLKRRNGEEHVAYPSRELKEVLHKTLGVPLFQEQAMRIAVVAAGFTPTEADQLRRSMAAFRRTGLVHTFEDKFIKGMLANGYKREFAQRCFQQILGFGDYGFPESHATSFALLVYASSWLKFHYPEVFVCALLNSQPMGFYAPAQLIADASRHGVGVLPVDVNASSWENTLAGHDDDRGRRKGLRLGFREIRGFSKKDAEWLIACRGTGYQEPAHLARRSGISKRAINLLARADAFASLKLSRRQSMWAANSTELWSLPLFAHVNTEKESLALPLMSDLEEVLFDYRTLGLSLKQHPMAFLRTELSSSGYITSQNLLNAQNGEKVCIAGIVVIRQRPPTANGVLFQTIEDEYGFANIVIWPKTYDLYKSDALFSTLIAIEGTIQRQGQVIHVIAELIRDISGKLDALVTSSRDFH